MIPPTYKISNNEYYLALELKEYSASFFKGCKNIGQIIINQNIPKNKYTYGMNINNKLIEVSGKSKKYHKLYILKKWIEENMPEFNKKIKYDVELAPDVFELNDNEKFRDVKNNVIKIETRGERKLDKCFFKVKDVSIAFGLGKLYNTLLDKISGYKHGEHYIYFNIQKISITDKKNNKEVLKKTLFLTYYGITRVLFVSKSASVTKFQKWAIDILFKFQLGTELQKNSLVARLKNIKTRDVNIIFSK
jgi:hypothetical protein